MYLSIIIKLHIWRVYDPDYQFTLNDTPTARYPPYLENDSTYKKISKQKYVQKTGFCDL